MTEHPPHKYDVPARDASQAVRTFVDGDGVSWRVHEQAFSEYDRRKGRSLIFSSDGAVRRVRGYPDEWMQLSAAELSDLSWKA
ncbi:MAG: hypothetical protein M3Z10_00370 [Gemmatimonadota bacterium]|nr:hypothetical protein [Gemmatimonadota bacterium]